MQKKRNLPLDYEPKIRRVTLKLTHPTLANYSERIKLIKYYFSHRIAKTERISKSRRKKGERGIWQRRFWEHWTQSEAYYRAHIDYTRTNPFKHRYVKRVQDW